MALSRWRVTDAAEMSLPSGANHLPSIDDRFKTAGGSNVRRSSDPHRLVDMFLAAATSAQSRRPAKIDPGLVPSNFAAKKALELLH